MPVRSLNSSVLRWPTYEEVICKLKEWIKEVTEKKDEVIRIGLFGSYARGDFGVGSDLDLIIIVESSKLPFERRGIEWDTTSLPVPVDLLIYTSEEWEALKEKRTKFYKTIMKEAIWLYDKS